MKPLEAGVWCGVSGGCGDGAPGARLALAGGQGLLHANVSVPSPACIVLLGPRAFPVKVF